MCVCVLMSVPLPLCMAGGRRYLWLEVYMHAEPKVSLAVIPQVLSALVFETGFLTLLGTC